MAQTITVTLGSADYNCNFTGLQNAIADAASGDTIAFDCPDAALFIFTETIIIPAPMTLTIDGSNGSDGTSDEAYVYFDGKQERRIFFIEPGATLTLKHLKLQNGWAREDESVVEGEDGGAIYNRGRLSVIDCTFSDNLADGGGAIRNSSRLSIDSSYFSENTAIDSGGAISSNTPFSITNSTFTMNQSLLYGGAIASTGGPGSGERTISMSTFTQNAVVGFGGFGGAIWSTGGTLKITQSTLAYNLAQAWGGAVYSSDGSTLQIGQSSLYNNSAGSGGAIYADASSTVTVDQSSFLVNGAALAGGAIHLSFASATITNSLFTTNYAVGGGGIFGLRSTLSVSRSIFSHNDATSTGGAINTRGKTTIHTSTFYENTAADSASTILVTRQTPNPEDPSTIDWSTIVQPSDTSPAISIGFSNPEHQVGAFLTLEGVILGGVGDHCQFNAGGALTDSYTLANDTSCGLDGAGSQQGIADLGLGPLTKITTAPPPIIEGFEPAYFPLEPGSPAVEAGLATCPTPDQIGTARPQGTVCDVGAFETSFARPVIDLVNISEPRNEGQPINVSFTASDGNNDSLTYSIDCDANDDAVVPVASTATTCVYPDNGSYTLAITASDGTLVGTANPTIDVLNVNPDLTTFSATPTTVMTGELVTINALAEDVPDDPLTYTYDCDGGTLVGDNQCQFDRGGAYDVSVLVTDGDGGEAGRSQTIQVFDTASLCANRWNGALRMASDCSRNETHISLPLASYADLALCVNQWNGATRASDRCSRSEQMVTTRGQDTIHVCVNQWNGTIRVSDRCSRSEHEDWL